MKILVPLERVADLDRADRLAVTAAGDDLDLRALERQTNPFDLHALEAALRLTEDGRAPRQRLGEVVVVTLGPEDADVTLRNALGLGADRAVRVTAAEAALDGRLVAKALARLVGEERPDLVLLGKQAVDGDSNQVTQLLAEYLGLPQACFISKIAIEGSEAVVTREVDGGLESIAVTLPAIVSADLRLNTPRLPTLPNVLKAKRKPIQVLAPATLGVDVSLKVVTERYEAPPQRKGGIQVKTVEELMDRLVNEAKAI